MERRIRRLSFMVCSAHFLKQVILICKSWRRRTCGGTLTCFNESRMALIQGIVWWVKVHVMDYLEGGTVVDNLPI